MSGSPTGIQVGQSSAVVFGLVTIMSTLVVASGVVLVLFTVAPALVPIAVAAGEETSGIDGSIGPPPGGYPGGVEGIIAGADGVPLADIEVSLYHSLQEIGAPLTLAPKMNDILGWDIDFNRDLRKGDTFRILDFQDDVIEAQVRRATALADQRIEKLRGHGRAGQCNSQLLGGFHDNPHVLLVQPGLEANTPHIFCRVGRGMAVKV